MNEFVEGSGFHHITVRAAGIASHQVGLVVRRGEDDDGDRGEAGIGSETFQEVAAIPSAKLKIKKDQSGERVVVDAVFQEMERRLRVMLGIEGNIEAGLFQRQAKQFALAGAVFDQEDGGMRNHI